MITICAMRMGKIMTNIEEVKINTDSDGYSYITTENHTIKKALNALDSFSRRTSYKEILFFIEQETGKQVFLIRALQMLREIESILKGE